MSKWIDADALIVNMRGAFIDHVEEFRAITIIKDAPSIDIVRCKECRHSFINENHPQKPRICGLTKKCGTTKDDWYCADGERESDDIRQNNRSL